MKIYYVSVHKISFGVIKINVSTITGLKDLGRVGTHIFSGKI